MVSLVVSEFLGGGKALWDGKQTGLQVPACSSPVTDCDTEDLVKQTFPAQVAPVGIFTTAAEREVRQLKQRNSGRKR